MDALATLVERLKSLPGVGQRTAERLAHHLLKVPADEALALADAIRALKERLRPCSVCFQVTEEDPCAICRDPSRDARTILVVEQLKDLQAFERIGTYRGVYHVLTGAIAPLDGVRPDDLTVAALEARVRAGGVDEVILATSPTLEGDGTALYVQGKLEGTGVRVTRLARGIPSGTTIEYASGTILEDALDGRRPMA